MVVGSYRAPGYAIGNTMGHHNGVSTSVMLTGWFLCLLIVLERVQASEFTSGRWRSDQAVATTSALLPSSLSHHTQSLPTVSGEGSGGSVFAERAQDESSRRELITRYSFISYGFLTAGFVPCPPRSGRSYYTSNCKSASGPVRPYHRGCSRLSRCARG